MTAVADPPLVDKRSLAEERASLIKQGREINELAETEKRSLSAEESEKLDRFEEQIDRLDGQLESIDRRERWDRLEKRTAETRPRQTRSSDLSGVTRAANPEPKDEMTERRNRAYSSYIRGGIETMLPEERRDLSMGSISEGGALTPETFVNQLIQAIDEELPLFGLFTKYTVNSGSGIGIPTLDTDPSDAEWTSEIATGTKDSSMAFGKRSLSLFDLRKKILISNKLLEQANPEPIVMQRLGRKFSEAIENNTLNAHGANRCVGIFHNAGDAAIPTSQDVAFASGTALDADTLITAQESLRQGYWARAKWLFHRQGMRRIRQLKDGQGRYLWETGNLTLGPNGELLGMPVLRSPYCPSTFTSGLYVGALADFSCYAWCQSSDVRVRRLVELYAETDQTGFIGTLRGDGQPADPYGFIRLKMG
jgi:Predicted phage phi-C31 gp36 major capsid-like protein